MALLRVSKFEYLADSKEIHIVYTIVVDRKSKVNTLDIQGSKVFIFGKLRVDVVNQAVYLGRKLVLLSPTEFQLLLVFCRMPSTLIPKEHLLKSVWNRRSIGTRILDVYIGRLNKKLRDKGGPDYSIQNVHSRGYMFLTQLFGPSI
ncbi:MAG: winged helix-turn-helix domain-containing protein [Proteobacteria bacterium]|nr:winged helix-turn-helix domain-containing protein [Pseudomonadota bacterium]